MERGNMDLAIRHLKQSMKDAKQSKFLAGEILTSTYLSKLYSELGHYQLVNDTVDDVINVQPEYSLLAKSFFLGIQLLAMAKSGEVDEAEKLIKDEKSIVDQMNVFARQYYQLGLCYLSFAKEDYEDTIQISKDFLQLLQSNGVEYLIPEFRLLIAKAQINLGLWNEAETTLETTQHLVEKLGSKRSQWQVDYLLGRCALHNGDQKEALEYFGNSKKVLSYILEHISNDDLKRHFMKRESVKYSLDAVVEAG